VRGKDPEAYATVAKMERMNKVFTEVLQNSRTLLASYRQEREFDLRTQIRQQ
jgi:hypothetical protein